MFKNFFIILIVCFAMLSLSACGVVQKAFDEANYQRLSGKRGNVYVLSGGQIMFEYKDAKIEYSSADSQTLFILTADNKNIYVQGDAVIELK